MILIATQSPQTAPAAYPVVGHLPQFVRDRLGFLTRCAKTDDSVVRLRLGGDAYLLLDALDIKHVLEANYPNYDKSDRMISSRGKRVSGYGVLTSTGPEHLEKRRILQPAFSANNVAPLAGMIVSEIEKYFSGWRDGLEFDAAAEMINLAQCINGRILLSADYNGADSPLRDAIRVRRQFIQQAFNPLPLAEHWPTPTRLAFGKAQRLIDRDIHGRIAERRADPTRFPDMLSRLVSIMDDRNAHDEAVTAAITGYETIGECLAWTCLLLAQHPEIERKLAAEVKDVLRGRTPTSGDLPRLTLAEMVLSEAMRLYPPTWIYVRVAKLTDRLPSGIELPAGAKLYLCPWVIHRSEHYYSDPLKFNPMRFEDAARKSRPKYAYFPFGGGPRICIGQALAKMQMPLMLAMFVQRFTMSLLPGQIITPDPRITLRPHPAIRMRLAHR